MYRLELQIPGLPKMANASGARSTHWRYAQLEAKKWKSIIWIGVRDLNKQPPQPLKKFTLTLTRFSSVEPDYDGLVRGFKHCVDGLKMAGIIEDDKLSNTGPWICYWVKVKPKQGMIKIIVEGE